MTPWEPDVLGPGYEACTLPLEDDDEGEVVATLVRHRPPSEEPVRPARAVLYVHGWNDYFFQTGLAEYWAAQGAAFYALDLRKYGRSLRAHQTPNYVDDLATYDEDLAAALDRIHRDLGRRARVLLMGHSTGGLVGVLWAQRHPGAVTGLVLNSPWLELTGSSVMRNLGTPLVQQLARTRPKAPVLTIDPGFYTRTISSELEGEWTYDARWRPTPFFPIRPGWLQAVLNGHAQVARGLDLTVPVFMAASSRSVIGPRWREDMRETDTVLDVDLLARRAVLLGSVVTVVRIPGGLHDLTLSAAPARERFYAELSRWLTAYGWD
ncbi:alpha/beta hydrolase [Cellulomonas sp. APG4]|uniref:alpha/beta hydrolase n=1 Tax=Cellulomonas sp. APG4 TaxID=1538656 RepID=UPI00137B8952|nr:alpha/beta hydrolase [Cellulomonas sp. APG4]NCT91887.1 alpha/beta hydrolase [Cellulomonas sp. APG4]